MSDDESRTGSRAATAVAVRLVAALLVLATAGAAAEPRGTVESDPAVVRLLPPGYPRERVRVDAQQPPWRAVGRVTVQGGGRSCTGTLVGERHVLTAAHCVWRHRDHPEQVNFLAGFQQEGYVAHARAARIHLCEGFAAGPPSLGRLARDCAILEMAKPIGRESGHVGWTRFDRHVLADLEGRGATFSLSGYRGDRLGVQTVDHDCRIGGFAADGRVMTHACPTTGGDSGGPILLRDGEGYLLVGIDVAVRNARHGPEPTTEGLAIPTANFQDMLVGLGIAPAPLAGPGDPAGRAPQ
jgi:protease YdgD